MMDNALQGDRIIGREETLKYLRKSLVDDRFKATDCADEQFQESDRGRLAALVGLPGVGKTAVAAAFASSCRDKFDGSLLGECGQQGKA